MKILVTAGPTVEPLDAVRVLTNRSTGRMGHAVAAAAARRGHDVTMISGSVAFPPPRGVRVVRVGAAREMLAVCRRVFPRADALVMAAAVSDYRPARPARGKRHKTGLMISLPLVRNPDILATLCRRKGKRLAVGFALENSLDLQGARKKMRRKGADAIILNALESMGGAAFRGILLPSAGRPVPLGPHKASAARRIVAWIETRLATPRPKPR